MEITVRKENFFKRLKDVASAAWIFSARSFAIFVGGNLPNLVPKSIGPLGGFRT